MIRGMQRCWLALALGLTLTWPGPAEAAFDFNDAGWEGTGALLEIAEPAPPAS